MFRYYNYLDNLSTGGQHRNTMQSIVNMQIICPLVPLGHVQVRAADGAGRCALSHGRDDGVKEILPQLRPEIRVPSVLPQAHGYQFQAGHHEKRL